MSPLVAEVLAVLKEGAERIRPDLWQPQDADALEHVAHDLVGLARKIALTTDDAKLAQYRRSAKLLVQHVELLALRRARQLEQAAQDEVERVFREHVLPALIGLLPAVL